MSCQSGTYADTEGSISCDNCPSGHVASYEATSCTPCSAGEAPSSDKSYCQPCYPGLFSSSGVSCEYCPPGEISGDHGATSCTQCLA